MSEREKIYIYEIMKWNIDDIIYDTNIYKLEYKFYKTVPLEYKTDFTV